MPIKLLLASQSPRRRELMRLLGYPFQCMSVVADEASITTPDPAANVMETAALKMSAITPYYLPHSDNANPRTVVIAADTTVALDNKMLNKPVDAADARRMLRDLRQRTHEVHTGYVLFDPQSGQRVMAVHSALVTMRNYSEVEIETYVESGDPMDKAGAYAIQHPTFQPVSDLNGCFLSVMGLPVCNLLSALQYLEVPFVADLTAVRRAHQGYACHVYDNLASSA